jgi:hypothetical protein
MVKRYLRQDHKFVCVGNSPFEGWWAKISLFEPGRFEGRVLYLDLDVTVVGPLDDLVAFDEPFVIMKDAFRMGFNSSVMAWDAGAADHIYLEYLDRGEPKVKGGDQSWVFQQRPSARLFPRQWCQSFKQACIRGGFQPDMRVCIFHGWPKPWDLHQWM